MSGKVECVRGEGVECKVVRVWSVDGEDVRCGVCGV